MESIVLHSDIARLVLGYFVNNNLKRAALALCRTSPHLHQEYIALRQGLQPHNFLNGGLEDIILEHVKITSLVTNALQKLPIDIRQRLQQLKLSERVSELLKLDKLDKSTLANSKESASTRNANTNVSTQRKRRRGYGLSLPSDGDGHARSASPSPAERRNCKRRRLLDPQLYCSIGRSSRLSNDHLVDNASLDSSTASDLSSENTDDALQFDRHGHGPKKNSTPLTETSEEAELKMPVPQTMPEITHAIMTNREFQTKLLNNINTALQSLAVHAPTAESVNNEAVLDGLVRNILEATEKEPSFDRIIQDVVGMETPTTEPVAGSATTFGAEFMPDMEPKEPPQTPMIIRAAIASANASAAMNNNNDVNVINGSNSNAIIQLNGNSSIGTLIDPNFSISKLIVLNSNESAQKQQPSANVNFDSENLINFADGGIALADAEVEANAAAAIGAAAGGGQVCVDATNGQLTFPMFLSNEGLLSHLPFLVNNEWLTQQLRSDAFINMDVSHIEIPLPEPITVTANQLPPNSIIINSAVKQPPTTAEESLSESPSQLIAEQPNPVTANAPILGRSTSKIANTTSTVSASLDSSRLVVDRVTPQTSGIVNVKAIRSLSTPRKRTSHVRTLNFSPKSVTTVSNTPLSTRRLPQRTSTLNHQLHQRRTQLKALKEKQTEELELESKVKPEKPVIINSVEILPSFGSTAYGTAAAGSANAAATMADVSGNDSNGNIPPLFAMEESSNQTVIKAVAASKRKVATCASTIVTLPKRKQKRRGTTKASKHVTSNPQETAEVVDGHRKQLGVEKDASSSLDDSKENQRTPSGAHKQNLHGEESELLEDQEDLLIAWQRQMQSSSTDLEQRLREINAKRQMFQNKVRVRQKRSTSNKNKTATQGTLQTSKQKKLKSTSLRVNKKEKAKQLQHLSGNNMENEFIIKITPPQNLKVNSQEPKESEDLIEPNESKNIKEEKQLSQVEEKVQPASESEEQKKLDKVDDQQLKQEQQKQLDQQSAPELVKAEAKAKPLERALANMAILLDSPFKAMLSDGGVDVPPPTPGPTLMDTPCAKLLPSTSFLFGSDTKSILDTPMLTAITPGVALATPFSHMLGTPLSSGAKTDYSGGSSYYRPDEAEHTDTNAQCALPETSPRDLGEPLVIKQTNTCIELHAERLPVEPTVLRRVRSFGSEAVDSAEGAAAMSANGERQLVETPHYKLVSGLPDAIIEHCSSSSSGSSSTSSSSTTSSSSGSSDSSSSNNSSASSAKSSQLAKAVAPARTMKLLELDNLSDISSAEDEEWLKVAAASGTLYAPPLGVDNEPAQLVSQDGEVRYPLRSWLTPSKDAAAAAATNANTSGEMAPPETAAAAAPEQQQKSVEDISLQAKSIEQRMSDLAEVCERVKAKVKESTAPKARSKNTNKKLTTMRETAHAANPKPVLANKTSSKRVQLTKSEKKPKDNQSEESAKSVLAGGSSKVVAKSKSVSSETAKVNVNVNAKSESSASNLDPALLKALNLSAEKQQHPRTGRAAVQIAAQPAPSTSAALRRGRPKKSSCVEPSRCSTRRSSRLIDNKTPAPEEKEEKPSKAAGNAKVTKKPAKKRAEARVETAAPPLATLPEAQTTHEPPEEANKQPQNKPSTPPPPPPTVNSDYDLDMCKSDSHLANTFCFTYADSGSKPAQPVQSQPAAFFTNFQMRIMVDNEMHNVRITSPQLLYQSLPIGEESANATSIRNIPKKRIRIRLSSGGGAASSVSGGSVSQDKATAEGKPMASSTPLAKNAQSEEPDDNDLEVANINTPSKGNTSEEQQMEIQDGGVQIEDIESILSHLHGT